jgi:transposase
MDQAGWHLSAKLLEPANITVLPLPPKCPELKPAENVREFMRDNCIHPVKATDWTRRL